MNPGQPWPTEAQIKSELRLRIMRYCELRGARITADSIIVIEAIVDAFISRDPAVYHDRNT